jgi:pre-mRNA-splicing factor ATP-dependent RNA helicase DHX16
LGVQYRIPEAYDTADRVAQDRRFAVASDRYRDPEHEEKANNFAEQEAWEKYQIGKATLKFGAADKKNSDDYEYVFEDQIEFIQASIMPGSKGNEDDEAEKKAKESAAKSAYERLQVQAPYHLLMP